VLIISALDDILATKFSSISPILATFISFLRD
jgi:hypothetical protein